MNNSWQFVSRRRQEEYLFLYYFLCPLRGEILQIFTNQTNSLKDLIRFVGFLAKGD